VFRYYSIANKLDDTWFSGAYALSQACMNVFEANGYSRNDALAVNSYSKLSATGPAELIFSCASGSRFVSQYSSPRFPRKDDQSPPPPRHDMVPIW
jgi:hypothetical protein